MNEQEMAAGMAAPPGYRFAVTVGNELYVAGQVPLDGDGRLVGRPRDAASQAQQCLQNLTTVIAANGFDAVDIRHLTIYVVGEQADLAVVWSVITRWFAANVPPATLLGVVSLGHEGQTVEIDARVVRS